MRGTVALEEAVLDPRYTATSSAYKDFLSVYKPQGAGKEFGDELLDIHDKRLQRMDAYGVEYMVLSITSPGCQEATDKVLAERMAFDTNNYLAEQVHKNPRRFGAFAAVSMHDATQAAIELKRAVKELGMCGVLLNDWQSTLDEHGDERRLYYDSRNYDPFWEAVQELDVPVYLHPRYPLPGHLQEPWGSRVHLTGASVGFSLDLSWHLYALCSSTLFDRYPKLKIIVGHLGENIPFNLWRSSSWYNRMRPSEDRSKYDYSYYWHNNVYITTSGTFNTRGLKYCIDELGVERCLFSIDTPYNTVEQAQDWWASINLPAEQKAAIGRENAIRLLRLPLEI